MTLNTSNQEKAIKQASPGFFKAPAFWKRDKKHWLLAIALGCLMLWWWGSQIKETAWLQTVANWLPLIGSLAFAGETMLKLVQ